MLSSRPPIQVIGVPQDLGQQLRGVAMGPNAIRIAGLLPQLRDLGYAVTDFGDIDCRTVATARSEDLPNLHYADDVVRDAELLADCVDDAVAAGRFPLVLGGDHSIAIGTMAGLARHEPRQGLIWVDAHADFNTPETTPSGNIHGMPVASILGDGDPRLANVGGVNPKALSANTVLVGLRDVDLEEAERIRKSDISYHTMRTIDERGLSAVMEDIIREATANGVESVHLSFDTDAIDPTLAPGTGTTSMGGLTYREAHLMMEMLADADIITSAEFVEVNPTLDDGNATAELIVELIASLCGKRIVGTAAPIAP